MTDQELNVLLVEDDEDDYLITRELLEEGSFLPTNLIWRDNIHDGLNAFAKDPIDVALVDLRLGPDSGLDLIQEAQNRGITIPFILLTGQGDDELDARAVRIGAADYLVKNHLDAPTLIRSIRYAIDRARAQAALAQREAQYRLLFEANPALMCLVAPASGRIESMNASARNFFNCSKEQAQDLTLDGLNIAPIEEDASDFGISIEADAKLHRHTSADNSPKILEIKTEGLILQGKELTLFIMRDLTDQISLNEKLTLLERCVDSSSNGIVICDTRMPDLPIVYVNSTFEKITGYTRSETLGRNCRFLQGNDEYDLTNSRAINEIRHAVKHGHEVSVVLRNYRKDGAPFWNDLYISPIRGSSQQITHFVGVQSDISNQRSVENELAYRASHDVLTKLPNRALLEDRIAQACQIARRYERLAVVIFIDLDGFKLINDSLGHRAGDQILKETAKRLRDTVRPGDTVARISGDEFVILLPDVKDTTNIVPLIDTLLSAIRRPFQLSNRTLHLTGSAGITTSNGDIDNPPELIQQADLAMYRAKKQGKNLYQWFSEELNREATEHITLKNELQEAIDSNSLVPYYQPLVDARTGRTRCLEALIRWQHPEKGLISPGDFLPMAEETGLIVQIGKTVLEQACRDLVQIHASGFRDCTVAVNVSPLQLKQEGFAEFVSQTLTKTGLEPAGLEIEIIESAILLDTDEVLQTLHDLKSLGVRIAIDDFGTGFSSLSYVKLFPTDKIKIDRSFIKEVINSGVDSAITQAIISMAHHLGLQVVAEGVETEAQATFLKRNQCDLLQGFYFAKPMPLSALLDFLHTAPAREDTQTPDQDQQKTLLLLDDEQNILKALTRILRRDGYRILSTTSIKEAFSLLAENEVQVIISDQRMPEMSGTEFLSRVKKIHPNTVRIVLSGYTDLKSVTDAINEGAIYKFLTKPWDDGQIRDHIHKAFQYHQAMQE